MTLLLCLSVSTDALQQLRRGRVGGLRRLHVPSARGVSLRGRHLDRTSHALFPDDSVPSGPVRGEPRKPHPHPLPHICCPCPCGPAPSAVASAGEQPRAGGHGGPLVPEQAGGCQDWRPCGREESQDCPPAFAFPCEAPVGLCETTRGVLGFQWGKRSGCPGVLW